jgi:serine/threonine protein kinase
LHKIRVLGEGAFGKVELFEDPTTHNKIAIKFFNRAAGSGPRGSAIFFREIEALIQLTHPCVLRIVGYSLSTSDSRAQIATEFAAGGSLREALPRLDDTERAIVICSIVVGMRFIHSRGFVHRDLKPENIMLDERGFVKVGELGSSRFCDMRVTMTSGVGTPRSMAPDMCKEGDYTGSIDVYSLALILCEVSVGERAFPATMTLLELATKVWKGHRPELLAWIDSTVRQMIKRGWSVDADVRDSFASIFETLKQVEFKARPGVDMRRVAEYLALVERQANAGPMDRTGAVESERMAANGIRSGSRATGPPGQNQKGTRLAPTQPTVPPDPKAVKQFPPLVEKPRAKNQ